MDANYELHKRLQGRRSDLEDEFNDWQDTFRQLQKYIQPRRGRFELTDKPHSNGLNKSVVDPTAREALKTFRSGMTAGLTPPSRPWFAMSLMMRGDQKDSHAVKDWLHEVTSRMQTVMSVSNIYQTLPRAYEDLGLFGTHTTFCMPDFDNVVHTMPLPMGEYYIGCDDKMRVDSLHREVRRTVGQIVGKYGIENVSDAIKQDYEQGRLNGKHNLHIAIEPRRKRNPLSMMAKDKPIMQAAWEASAPAGQFLEITGYNKQPFITARWDVESPNSWGFSPAMDILGQAAQLQGQTREKAIAIQKGHNPPMMMDSNLRRGGTKNFPGGVTYVDSMQLQKSGARTLYDTKPDIQGLLADIADVREQIQEGMYNDLFKQFAQLDRSQITATEIIKRYEEKILLLGPALERLQKELLEPLVDLVFEYCADAGLFPAAPPELEPGQMLSVEYKSTLAQAMKAVGIETAERSIGYIGTLAQLKPAVLDYINEGEYVKEFTDLAGLDPSLIHDEDTVMEIRKQRQEAEQQQQIVDSAMPLAGAANLISEIDQGQQQ